MLKIHLTLTYIFNYQMHCTGNLLLPRVHSLSTTLFFPPHPFIVCSLFSFLSTTIPQDLIGFLYLFSLKSYIIFSISSAYLCYHSPYLSNTLLPATRLHASLCDLCLPRASMLTTLSLVQL
jgi:hypothetical protein